MRKPLIGITCGTSANDPAAKNPQDRLNRSYSHAVSAAGGIPVVLPNDPDSPPAELVERIDGLLLSGGYDVHPRLFNESILNGAVQIDGPRDDAELPLIRLAIERNIPIFAICRGIQSLNVALGGSLIQDIPEQIDTAIGHNQPEPRDETTHNIDIADGSTLRRIVGTSSMAVNSFHHQALGKVAEGLIPVAWAPDGIIEGVEMPSRAFVVGVQFHPEEITANSDGSRRLFAAFVDYCGERLS